MLKLLGIVVLGLLLFSPAYSATKTKLTIKEVRDMGFELTHVGSRDKAFYLIFEKDKEIYSCAGTNNTGYRCWHLTDGKK